MDIFFFFSPSPSPSSPLREGLLLERFVAADEEDCPLLVPLKPLLLSHVEQRRNRHALQGKREEREREEKGEEGLNCHKMKNQGSGDEEREETCANTRARIIF
jgi:hypothetical protein